MRPLHFTLLLSLLTLSVSSQETPVASVPLGRDYKLNVRLATTEALPAVTATTLTLTADAVGALSVDSVAVALYDRILVKNQADARQNGIYYVSRLGTGGVAFRLTRSSDSDSWNELPGAIVWTDPVGTDNDKEQYYNDSAPGGTLGSTDITYIEKGATGAGTGDALVADPLSQFAATTSGQLKGVLSDELGDASGKAIFALGTLAIASGKTATINNTITLTATDGSTLAIGTGGTLGTGAYATIASYLPLAGGTMTGNLIFNADNTLDIGASGATRPRTGYFGTSIVVPTVTATTLNGAGGAVTVDASGFDGNLAVTDNTLQEIAQALDDMVGSGSVATDTIWDAAGDLVLGTGSNTAARLAKGTALQVLQMNAGATTAEWGAVTGTGSSVRAASPTLSGAVTFPGTFVTVGAAVGALAIDVASAINTKSVATESEFSFSATPASGTTFSLILTNSDTANHTITVPSSFSHARGGAITTFTLAASGKAWLTWYYDGSIYHLNGDPTTVMDLTAETAPHATNDFMEFWDASAGAHRRATPAEMFAAGYPATLAAANGANLTALNGTNIASGTVADARIDAAIARLASPTFTGTVTVPDNSFALGTKTTGSYAAGDAEAGNASTVVVVDSTDATSFPAMFDSATGGLAAKTDAGLTYASDSGTLSANVLTEGANAVYNSSETPGGELGGTWASPTIDDSVTVTGWNLGASTATSATAGDDDTSVATTEFVQDEVDSTLTGSHTTPSTTDPLSPTWTGPTHVVFYGATGEINLPAAAGYTGRGIIVYNTGAFTIALDPNASEVIVRDGTVQTGGVTMTLSSGAGNYVALLCDGVRWISLGYKGTLAAGS